MTDHSDSSLSVSRTISAPRSAVWRCWTEPDLLKQWFCPKPWTVPEADMDVRPGGRMNIIMAGPTGERMETVGCYLEVLPMQRLVFTDAFSEEFMPCAEPFLTSMVELADAQNDTTQLVWTARHATPEARSRHLEMGFENGWNAALDQLDELARSLQSA